MLFSSTLEGTYTYYIYTIICPSYVLLPKCIHQFSSSLSSLSGSEISKTQKTLVQQPMSTHSTWLWLESVKGTGCSRNLNKFLQIAYQPSNLLLTPQPNISITQHCTEYSGSEQESQLLKSSPLDFW